jgi:hypothetical protein
LKTLLKNLAELLKVKTLITLAIIVSLCWAFLRGEVPTELFAAVASSVITYYFTKAEGKNNAEQ